MDATPRPARLAVGVISAGRVGSVLGAALARAGHVVTGVSAVSQVSRNRADELLPGVPIADPTEVAAHADLVLLAVPDDELEGLVKGLVATESLRAGQIVVHTSGAMGVQVLEPAAGLGALTLALHPVMTFTGRPEDLQRMSAACVGVTAADGDEVAWSVGEALVVEMDAEPVRVPESVRPLYHSALAHGANHLITLVRDAADLLTGSGIANAERLLGPLLSAALDNALRHGDRALTGPVARGDTGTLRKHLDVLARQAPEILPSYRVLARRTAERAEDSGLLKPDAANDVRTTLED
ncbi:Predicted oxidoreductase, contains short-chain dehydrogenase (SDR) and DUF2520 domains [Lentzea albidocapillata subsp. violacea]|uniref:Predicted oxidoreductase, contains short-chain dehydrogenase (SDR) and DUF2520 domains n=1 Tax=Lentzea albidocapillata subsp. violacea TaxID=128104 RepID=A0A1G9HQY9_9PSEU|nr:DUF2520 domain-containing protein [Lentzea albidocapillata]SDL15216.1 Predicted oxidoreductase, contains short-chain dehydrogenase (SDR) and DUF2520 domains [Lentzea albidocapillata subsp. violacea]